MEKVQRVKSNIICIFLFVILVTILAIACPKAAFAQYRGFSDVVGDEWFASEEVLGYTVDHGFLKGYGNGATFGPYDCVTRGQVATILWRMAGEPSATSIAFEDVDYSEYYGNAIRWARAEGVISGYQDLDGAYRCFGPNDSVTREQLVVMLSNYASKIEGKESSSDCSKVYTMPDSYAVSSYAVECVGWAMDNSIISGKPISGISYILPLDNAQRCETAKMIAVFHRDVLTEGSYNAVCDVVVDDAVIEISSVNLMEYDSLDKVAVLKELPDNLQIGDVLMLPATDDAPFGSAIVVEAYERNWQGYVITGTQASLGDVYETILLDEDFVYSSSSLAIMSCSDSLETLSSDVIEVSVKKSLGAYGTLSGKVKLENITGHVYVDYSRLFNRDFPRAINFVLDCDLVPSLSVNVTSIPDSMREIKLTNTPIPIPFASIAQCGILVDVYATLDVSGQLTFSTRIATSVEVEAPIFGSLAVGGNASVAEPLQVSLSGTASIGLGMNPAVQLLEFDLVGAGIEGGFKTTGKIIDHDASNTSNNDLICIDLSEYFYAHAYAEILGDFEYLSGAKATLTIFDASSSPFTWSLHLENGKLVDSCTWSDDVDESLTNPSTGIQTYYEGEMVELTGTIAFEYWIHPVSGIIESIILQLDTPANCVVQSPYTSSDEPTTYENVLEVHLRNIEDQNFTCNEGNRVRVSGYLNGSTGNWWSRRDVCMEVIAGQVLE